MQAPPWLSLIVGGMVLFFGVYRLIIALRSGEKEEQARQRGGLFGRSRQSHLLIGILYLALGTLLVLSGLGIRVRWW